MLRPQYDPSLPGIYQSTGYYVSPPTQPYPTIGWYGIYMNTPQAVNFGYGGHPVMVDSSFPNSATLTGTVPNGGSYYPPPINASEPMFGGADRIALQRANASHGNVGDYALIDRARAARIRSQSRYSS
jgi:hypothetical protein